MRGYKTDVLSSHIILKYLLITKLGIQPSEIEKMGMQEINQLLIIHAEMIKIENEKSKG